MNIEKLKLESPLLTACLTLSSIRSQAANQLIRNKIFNKPWRPFGGALFYLFGIIFNHFLKLNYDEEKTGVEKDNHCLSV
jgi:hypothetical protein